MGLKASKTAIEKSADNIDVANEPSKDVEWKEPPDGGLQAWLVVFGSFCVS